MIAGDPIPGGGSPFEPLPDGRSLVVPPAVSRIGDDGDRASRREPFAQGPQRDQAWSRRGSRPPWSTPAGSPDSSCPRRSGFRPEGGPRASRARTGETQPDPRGPPPRRAGATPRPPRPGCRTSRPGPPAPPNAPGRRVSRPRPAVPSRASPPRGKAGAIALRAAWRIVGGLVNCWRSGTTGGRGGRTAG